MLELLKRFLTSLLSLLVLCWAQCSMSHCGEYMDGDERGQDGSTAMFVTSPPQPDHGHGGGDLLTDGATLTDRQHFTHAAPWVVGVIPPLALTPPKKGLMRLGKVALRAPPVPRLGEMLACTACPVRGPTTSVA